MIEKPIAQNAIDDSANTMKFLARMLTAFLARHRPVSSVAKPAFMKNTSMPAIITHSVSSATLVASRRRRRVLRQRRHRHRHRDQHTE